MLKPALGAADQPVVDLQLALHTIAGVAQPRQRTTAALHVARGHVVEHERLAVSVAGQVAAGERKLDPVLSLEQSVHRPEQLSFGHLAERELIGQRALRKEPRRGQLRARSDQPLADHRDDQIPLTAAIPAEEPLQVQVA
jgi:hypothetical protein